ncbi:hypothetical protein [Teichococcus oryzae]|uniref:DUF4365 domain-containing protein n=1 Tax=Teichococcus oryzae TaxID=1608942 RepID=A0A5B2TBJ5_9PROT|nr:hypothetical protein [Pseudoroseomonas oryzae]KAA2211218.1 hypothetical protein F0Q34_21305 [Pseudoroseomonas oryzae]
MTNTLRGMLVEAMIDAALPAGWTWCSADYESFDFISQDGVRLEVKQSAARQSWALEGSSPSKCSFDIAPRTGRWDGPVWIPGIGRNADLYVFAHHPVADLSADHREPVQWRFYVVSTHALPATKRISLSKLQAMLAPVVYADLAAQVEAVRCAVLSERSAALADN